MKPDYFSLAVELAREAFAAPEPEDISPVSTPLIYEHCYYCVTALESQDLGPYCSSQCAINAENDSPF